MGIGNRYDGAVDDNAVRTIKRKARQLVGHNGFTVSDLEDIEQDLIQDLLRRLPKYDPTRAQRSTFIARVIEHRVATIIEARKAKKRDYRRRGWSLNERLEDGEGGSIERGEMVDQEDYLRRTRGLSRPAADLRDLVIDVHEAVEKLSPKLRELARRLETQPISEISRDTGVPRSTLYERIKELRAFFGDAGLQEYL